MCTQNTNKFNIIKKLIVVISLTLPLSSHTSVKSVLSTCGEAFSGGLNKAAKLVKPTAQTDWMSPKDVVTEIQNTVPNAHAKNYKLKVHTRVPKPSSRKTGITVPIHSEWIAQKEAIDLVNQLSSNQEVQVQFKHTTPPKAKPKKTNNPKAKPTKPKSKKPARKPGIISRTGSAVSHATTQGVKNAATWTGRKTAQGARAVGQALVWTGERTVQGAQGVGQAIIWTGEKTAHGTRAVGHAIAQTGSKTIQGANNLGGKLFSRNQRKETSKNSKTSKKAIIASFEELQNDIAQYNNSSKGKRNPINSLTSFDKNRNHLQSELSNNSSRVLRTMFQEHISTDGTATGFSQYLLKKSQEEQPTETAQQKPKKPSTKKKQPTETAQQKPKPPTKKKQPTKTAQQKPKPPTKKKPIETAQKKPNKQNSTRTTKRTRSTKPKNSATVAAAAITSQEEEKPDTNDTQQDDTTSQTASSEEEQSDEEPTSTETAEGQPDDVTEPTAETQSDDVTEPTNTETAEAQSGDATEPTETETAEAQSDDVTEPTNTETAEAQSGDATEPETPSSEKVLIGTLNAINNYNTKEATFGKQKINSLNIYEDMIDSDAFIAMFKEETGLEKPFPKKELTNMFQDVRTRKQNNEDVDIDLDINKGLAAFLFQNI